MPSGKRSRMLPPSPTSISRRSQREAQEAAIEVFTKAGVKVQTLTFEEYSAWLQIAKDGPWKSYRALSPRAADLFNSMLQSFIDSGKLQ